MGGYGPVDFLPWRGILAFTILIDHLSQELMNPGAVIGLSWTGYIVVSLFFGISGYGLSFQMEKSQGNYINDFLRKRLPKILVPFWTSNVVYVLVRLFLYHEYLSVGSIVKYIIGLQLINTNAWYVVSLLILYLAFWLSEKAIQTDGRQYKVIVSIGVLCTVYFCLVLVLFRGQRYWWVNSIFAFVVGMCINQYKKLWNDIKNSNKALILVAMLFVASFLLGWKLPALMARLPFMIIASITSVLLFFGVTGYISLRSKILNFSGMISYEIYLIHNCYRHFFKDVMTINNDVLYLIVVISSSVVTAVVLHKINEMILKKLI